MSQYPDQDKKDFLFYSDLITSLKTTREVADFVSEIDTLMLTFFKSEDPSLEKALSSIGVDSARKIAQFFQKNNFDTGNKDVIIDFFETLKSLMKKFKVIKLVLAFNPTHKTIENIYNFVKDIAGIGYIFDLEVSEDILGGIIIIFNGKYSDLTLKRDIEETFNFKNKEILQLYK